MRKIFTLLILAILATASSWAETKTGTITFSKTGVKISSASVTGDDDLGNTWTITTVGTTYFASEETYCQVGSSKKPATSITFTATLPSEVKITSMSAKFSGFSGTAGSIKLSVGDTEVGGGSLNATTDVTVKSTTEATSTVLTVSITGIAKGVKCYNISYTYEDAASDTRTATTLSFGADIDGKTITKYVGEPDWEFTHEATLSPAVDGATITYTSSNEDVAMVEDGYVMGDTKAEGIATIKAAYAGNDTYKPSEASYNIEVKKLPVYFSIADGTTVKKGAVVKVSSVEGATLLYQVNDGDSVQTETNTADITINETSKIEVTASYNGASSDNAVANYTVGKVVESIAIGGTLATTEYWVGDDFKTDGLTVTATYDDASTEDVTAKSTLAATPATLSEAGEQEVTVTATYGTLTATAPYNVTVKGIANTKETAYTVADAIRMIDQGKDLTTKVYVKGIVSEITTAYASNYGNISFNVSDDGTKEAAQFMFYRNQKDADNKYTEDPNIKVGATVIGYGTLLKYNTTYEFDAGNYLVEYTAPAEKVVESIAISGEPTKTEYSIGDTFNPAGLTVTATYDDATTADVTADVTWTFDPATFTESGDNKTVNIKATYNEKEATATATVNVGKAPLKYVIDLTKDETTTATTAKMEWVKDVVTVTYDRIGTATIANSYYPGNGKATTRFYQKNKLTFTPANNIAISYIVYDAAETKYAAPMANSTWANATAVANGTTVTITPTDGSQAISATISATTGGNSFTIYYTGTPTMAMATVAAEGVEGYSYTVNDGVVVAKFEATDKHYLVVKDDAEAVRNSSAPAATDKFFNIAGNKQQDYAQNNWMLVSVPVETYNQVDVNKMITEATGTLTDALNTTLEATSVTVGDNAAEAYTPNTYCPANFMGESSVKAKDGSNYYFATPKANEYAKVVWAVYNATDGAFYLPAHSGSVNTQEFEGAFKVDYSMNSVKEPTLVNGEMYEFEGVIKEVAASEAQSAPRKVEANTTTVPSSKFVVYPVNLDGNKVVTGVSEVTGAKAVKSVSYFNMMGEQSAEPFSGVNIVVTTYTDGTTHAQKAIR